MGKDVGEVGYGMMGMRYSEIWSAGGIGTDVFIGLTWRQTPPSREQSLETMRTALKTGANNWNGGNVEVK
jgi:hypothetical protein